MKKYLYILAAVVIAAGIFLADTANNRTPDTLSDKKIYPVAVSGTFAPFGMVGKDGKAQGFEVDLMNAIAKVEGVEFNYIVTSWAGKMPALQSGEVDIIICSLTITEERKREVEFTDPYFESTNYILVPEDSPVKSIDDLKGKTVAVLQASTSDFALSKLLGKDYEGIKRFKHTTSAFLELRNRKVDAAVGDSGVVMYYVKNNPQAQLRIIKESRFPTESYGMAVRKGDFELIALLNSGLKKIRADGTYDKIYQKWFSF